MPIMPMSSHHECYSNQATGTIPWKTNNNLNDHTGDTGIPVLFSINGGTVKLQLTATLKTTH
jgi:hypothetical protein